MTGKITDVPLWKQVWTLILTAASGTESPFSTPVIGSIHPPTTPRLRTVVLRDAVQNEALLRCYVDTRSVKISDLDQFPTLSWLFWDPEEKIQVSCSGTTRCLDDAETEVIFAKLPKHGRKAYATVQPPSSPLPYAASGLPDDWADRELADTDYARQNFGVLETQVDWMDILHLQRAGNHRLTARRDGEGWQHTWIVP